MRVRLIINPNAGSAAGGDVNLAAIEERVRAEPGGEVIHSEEAGHAGELARQAIDDGVERLIAAGGDGTINEVLNGLAPDFGRLELAIVPLGTGNDLARCLGLDSEDVMAATEFALRGKAVPLDVGRFTRQNAGSSNASRFFLNVSAGGFAGVVDQYLKDEDKQRWGTLAYVASAVNAMRDVRTYELDLEANGQRFTLPAYNVIVGNGRYAAGGIPVAPKAVMDDGLFDVALLPAAPLVQSLLASLDILRGTHVESEKVVTFRTASLIIRSVPPMPFNVDGELQPDAPEARFDILPRALMAIAADHHGRGDTWAGGETAEPVSFTSG